MSFLREKKGITLVVLAVAIVIMIILASITINLTIGDQGITKKAKNERDNTRVKMIEDAKKTYYLELELGQVDESISDYLLNKNIITKEEKTEIEDTRKLVIGAKTISFAKTLIQAFKDGDLQVGDWIDYKNPTKVQVSGEGYTSTGYTSFASRTGMSKENGHDTDINQTYSLTNNGKQVNWRILGLSEDGTQLIITTGSPLQRDFNSTATINETNSPYYYLYGAEGAAEEYGLKELNKICAIYKNSYATGARSLTMNDINRLCGVTADVENSKVYKISDSTKTNIDQGGNIGKRYSYPTTNFPTQYASPEDFLTGTSSSFSKTSDAYYYAVSDAISSTSALYDVLFSHTGQEGGDYRYYWLASHAVYVNSVFCYFGPGLVYNGGVGSIGNYNLFYSYGYEGGGGRAVRPVVSLKSYVTLDDIQKLDTAPTTGEEEWNY